MPVTLLKKINNKAYRLWYRLTQNRQQLEKLIQSDDSRLRRIGISFQDSLNKTLTTQEEKVSKKVEALRETLIDENGKISADNNGDEYDSIRYLATVASKKKNWAILLMKLISNFDLKKGLEFGTCIGISAAYQAGIMQEKGSGHFVTMEGINARKELSEENFQKLALNNIELHYGAFDKILPEVLEKHQEFDYLFIDGDHRHKATVENFEKVLPYMKENSIVVVDDIKWSEGMKKAWQEIKQNNQIAYIFDLFTVGICIVGEAEKPQEFKIGLW